MFGWLCFPLIKPTIFNRWMWRSSRLSTCSVLTEMLKEEDEWMCLQCVTDYIIWKKKTKKKKQDSIKGVFDTRISSFHMACLGWVVCRITYVPGGGSPCLVRVSIFLGVCLVHIFVVCSSYDGECL